MSDPTSTMYFHNMSFDSSNNEKILFKPKHMIDILDVFLSPSVLMGET